MTSLTVSGRVAQVLGSYLTDLFGVMGNGNVHFLDAAEQLGLRFSAVRHEGAAIAAADAYYRTSGRLAAGTTTYGPGYTNALTALAESVQAQIPVVLVTGDAPTSGARPQDVDQAAIAAGLGAATFTVTRDAAGSITQQAVEYALTKRTAVVLAIPYDLAALEAADEELPAPLAPAGSDDVDGGGHGDLEQVARLLAGAQRPLILAGRGAHLAGAGPELRAVRQDSPHGGPGVPFLEQGHLNHVLYSGGGRPCCGGLDPTPVGDSDSAAAGEPQVGVHGLLP